MLSPDTLSSVAPTAQELLAADQDRLVQFLDNSRTKGGGFDISRVVGVDDLSNGQRDEFSRKLSAAAAKAGPLNTSELSRLLGLIVDRQDDASDTPSSSSSSPQLQSRYVGSPTATPPSPESNHRFETFCHDELVKAGGRPAAAKEHIFGTLKDVEESRKAFLPWLDDTTLDSWDCDGNVPPLFSAQLEDWLTFRQKWQWDNRGRFAGDEGFSDFLESWRRSYLHKGETKMVSDPSFEATVRQIWKYEQRFLETSGTAGFAAYTRAVEERLTSHGFTQAFHLAEDPRLQDKRTTWVEYLDYVYWWHDRHVAAMKASEPQYRRAWGELQRFVASSTSPASSTWSFDKELRATKAELEATRQQMHSFIRNTRVYKREETGAHRQELRAQWVLQQLPLIMTEPEAVEHDLSPNGGGKRKLRDVHDADDAPARPQPKRMKQGASHSGSVPDLKLTTGDE